MEAKNCTSVSDDLFRRLARFCFFGSCRCSLRLTLLLSSFIGLCNRGFNLLHRIGLDDVPFRKITEVDDGDAALIACGNFLHLVLKAAQGVDLPVEKFDVVAQNTDLRVAVNLALENIGTRDKSLGEAHNLADLAPE